MIHAEPVVMLRGEDNRFHPCLFRQRHDRVGIPFLRIELPRPVAVPVAEDTGKRLDLFTVTPRDRLPLIYSTIKRIEPEVDKHRELLIEPLLRRFFLCRKGCDDKTKKEKNGTLHISVFSGYKNSE